MLEALSELRPHANPEAKYSGFLTDDGLGGASAPDLKAVISALENHPVFSTGGLRLFGSLNLQLHPTMIAAKLRYVTTRRGANAALDWLHKIFSCRETWLTQWAELEGVTVEADEPLRLSNGVDVLPTAMLPESFQGDSIRARLGQLYFVSDDAIRGSSILRRRFLEQVREGFKSPFPDYLGPFEDAALALTVASETAPVVGVSWLEYEDADLIDSQISYGHAHSRYDGRAPQYPSTIRPEVVAVADAFLRTTGRTRAACTTAAARLNLSRRRRSIGDTAIELCTAFEALLATKDELSELTYRFRLRAALLLGETLDERRSIADQVKKLYQLRGKVVHGAQFKASAADKKLVDWASEACSRLLTMIVTHGRLPDLEVLELTADREASFATA